MKTIYALLILLLIASCKRKCPCDYGHNETVINNIIIDGNQYPTPSDVFVCDSREDNCNDTLKSIWN